MLENTATSALLESVKLLAIGNACWAAPGLVPYFDFFAGGVFEYVRTVLNWVATLLAVAFMMRAALTAAPR